jgi:hypothetical protein
LSTSFLLDVFDTISQEIDITVGGFLLEKGDLVVEPFGDLLAAELELSLSVGKIQGARWVLGGKLSGSG